MCTRRGGPRSLPCLTSSIWRGLEHETHDGKVQFDFSEMSIAITRNVRRVARSFEERAITLYLRTQAPNISPSSLRSRRILVQCRCIFSAPSQVANPSWSPKPTILAWFAPHHTIERTAVGYYPVLGRLTSLTPLTSEADDKTAIRKAYPDRPIAVHHGIGQRLVMWCSSQAKFAAKLSCSFSVPSMSACDGRTIMQEMPHILQARRRVLREV
jgi:hypothetical protein